MSESKKIWLSEAKLLVKIFHILIFDGKFRFALYGLLHFFSKI